MLKMHEKLKAFIEYLYNEHGYWLFDWVLPSIGFILFICLIAYLVLKFVDPITAEIIIEVR